VAPRVPSQTGGVRAANEEVRQALIKLPPEQREALILVVASGFSYADTARICACRVGTIKSRVNRARGRLALLMAIEDSCDFDHGRNINAVTVRSRLRTRV